MNWIRSSKKFFLIPLLMATGCDSKDLFDSWIQSVEPLRNDVITRIPEIRSKAGSNLSEDQQTLLKKYFSALAVMAYEIKNDSTKANALNEYFSKSDLKKICSRTLIARSDWLQIVNTCYKNGYFLCAEEVRIYPEIVASLRSQLEGDSLKHFDAEPLCQSAL